MAEIVYDGVRVAIPKPEDYVVDFDHPKRQSVLASYLVTAIGLTLSTAFMLQRLYVKKYLRNTLGLDDLLLVIAWVGSVAIQGLIIYSFHATIMGVHGWEVPYETFRKFGIIGGYTTSIVYTVPTTLSKVVILLFYRQIDNPRTWYRVAVHTVIFIVGASGIAILFSSLFPCHNLQKAYDIDLAAEDSYCIDRKAMYQATAAIGVATDVLIIMIPIPMVIGLRMSLIKKAFLIGIFAVGSATVVTSIIRLALLISILDSIDQTWGGGPVCMWICVEANLLIICASLSTVKHFFKAVAPRLTFSTPSGSKKSSRSLSANHELRTFGAGSSRKRYYSRFDETDVGTDTIVRVQGLPHDEEAARDKDSNPSGPEDDGSDKGIIQTKETHVYYENK